MIAELHALTEYLAQAQNAREISLRCELTEALSASVSDAALVEALVTGLPMAQGISHRIVRSRGRGVVLTAKLRYRDGVRMLDHQRGGDHVLSDGEAGALQIARGIAEEALRQGGERERLRYLLDWVCLNIRYVHTAPGRKGYDKLVGAAGVLKGGAANCQGFADVMYLLCGLSGLAAEYCCGRGKRRLHLWNSVRVEGEWVEVDASKAARVVSD